MEDVMIEDYSSEKLISCVHSERSNAPVDVWDWQDYDTWRNVIWELISDIVNDDVRRMFRASPPKYVVSDNLGWLDEIILLSRGLMVDSKEHLADRLTDHFRAFRAVHGTRAIELSDYYSQGLIPHSPEKIQSRAREVFLTGEFPELTPRMMDEAISSVWHGTDEGRIFFSGNETELIKHCGHYMLYGSEHIVGIAARLEGHRDYRQVLKRYGTPTVFVCDIPLKLMDRYTIMEFAGIALEMVFQELLDGEGYSWDTRPGAALCIHHRLPPECIVGHYHPIDLHDPLLKC